MSGLAVGCGGLRVLVLSPHRDDAAFSCGLLMRALLRGGALVTVVNVCTISDYAPYLEGGGTAGDRVRRVTEVRAAEDAGFAVRLAGAVEWVDLGWKDAPLRYGVEAAEVLGGEGPREDEVARLGGELRQVAKVDAVVGPMAVGGHVDHRLVREAARRAFTREQLLEYEDAPYAGRLAADERARLEAGGLWVPRMVGEAGMKEADALCYASQIAPEVAREMEQYTAGHGYRERMRGEAAVTELSGLLERWSAAA